MMNRRNWISSSAFLGSSVLLNPSTILWAKPKGFTESPRIARLGANENPYGPSENAKLAIEKSILHGNRYPNEAREILVNSIASKFELEPESVVVGAGSSEILQLVANWCVRENLTVTTSKLTFELIPNYLKKFGGKVSEVKMTPAKGFDLNAIENVSRKNPGVVYIVNPNNPTGSKLDYNELLEFCKRVSKHSYVIVDEAYIEYVGENESMVSLIKDNPKVVVIRTFSKLYGLAGLRIGYALASPQTAKIIEGFQIWRGSNLNNLGIVAASASLNDITFLKESRSKNAACLDYTLDELRKLNLTCIDPSANFIWFRCDPFKGDISQIYASNDILVGAGEVDGEIWMRVSMGKMETMKRFIAVANTIWTS